MKKSLISVLLPEQEFNGYIFEQKGIHPMPLFEASEMERILEAFYPGAVFKSGDTFVVADTQKVRHYEPFSFGLKSGKIVEKGKAEIMLYSTDYLVWADASEKV